MFLGLVTRKLAALAIITGVLISGSQVFADNVLNNSIPNVQLTKDKNAANPTRFKVYTDGMQMTSLLATGPAPSTVLRWLNGTTQDGAKWSTAYFNGKQQWIITGAFETPPVGANNVQGSFYIADYPAGTTKASFPGATPVEHAKQSPQGTVFTDVTFGLTADYAGDGGVGLTDLNILLANFGKTLAQTVAAGPNQWKFDFTVDPVVGLNDLNRLLSNFGSAGPAPVPEPVAGGFALFGMLALAVRRWLAA
jgi:hypothetical protein